MMPFKKEIFVTLINVLAKCYEDFLFASEADDCIQTLISSRASIWMYVCMYVCMMQLWNGSWRESKNELTSIP